MSEDEQTPDTPSESPSSGPNHRRSVDRTAQIAGIAGKVLIGGGVLLLLFVLFQIFGTTYLQEQHQHALRGQIDSKNALGTLPSTQPNLPAVTVPSGPTPDAGTPIAVIVIPKLGVNQVVVQGTDVGDLELGPGHYVNTPLPGEQGNVSIAGHRTTWARPFYNLDQLKRGDLIYLATERGTFVYSVTTSQVVDPTDIAVLDATSTPTLTLTTCTPKFSAAQRLVVKADLSSTIFSLALHASTPSASTSKGGSSPAAITAGPSPLPAIFWGLITILLCVGAWFVASRQAGRRSWIAYGVATPLVLVSLFAFFSAISAHLPAGL